MRQGRGIPREGFPLLRGENEGRSCVREKLGNGEWILGYKVNKKINENKTKKKTQIIKNLKTYCTISNLPKILQVTGLNEYYLYILAPSHPIEIYT